MRIAVFSDLHVHNYKAFDKEGSRLENCLKVLDDVFSFCQKNDIRHILFCGDIVDQTLAVPTIAANALMTRLEYLFAYTTDISIIAVSGNHDQGSKSVFGRQAVTFLTQLAIAFPERFILIDENPEHLDDISVYGIPYLQHSEHFKQQLEVVSYKASEDEGVPKILMIHQTPSGLPNPMITADTDVNDPLYDEFDLVLCGHIHQKQQITNKFFLVGSPLHRDLGDEGDEKGFWVFDTEDAAGTMTFITRKGRYPEFKRVSGVLPEGADKDYIIEERSIKELTKEQVVEIDTFKASLTPTELIENYYNKVHGTDPELLKVGLKFV